MIIWNDDWGDRKIGTDKTFELCGNPLQLSYTTPKILWYKKNCPENHQHTYTVLQSNGFIVYRFTGYMTQDISQGYGLHCFDMHKGAVES